MNFIIIDGMECLGRIIILLHFKRRTFSFERREKKKICLMTYTGALPEVKSKVFGHVSYSLHKGSFQNSKYQWIF